MCTKVKGVKSGFEIILIKAFLVLLLLLVCSGTRGQENSDSIKFRDHFEKAKQIREQKDFDGAIKEAKKAEVYSVSLRDKMDLNLELAWNYVDKQLMDSSAFYLDKNINVDKDLIVDDELSVLLANSYRLYKLVYLKNGQYQKAIDVLMKSVEVLNKRTIVNSDLASSYLDMGSYNWRLGDYLSSLKWTKKSLVLAEKSDIEDKLILRIRSYIMLGLVYWKMGELEKAVDHYEFVFDLIGENKIEHSRDYFITCLNIGIVFKLRGDYDEAIRYYMEGESYLLNVEADAENRFLIPYYKGNIYNNLGSVYLKLNDFKKTYQYYNKAIKAKESYFGAEHPQVARTYNNIGNAYRLDKKYKEALKHVNIALDLNKKKFGNVNIAVSESYNVIAEIYLDSGEYKLSGVYYDSALMANAKVQFQDGQVHVSDEALRTYAGMVEIHMVRRNYNIDELFENVKNQLVFSYNLTDNEFESNITKDLLDQFYKLYYDHGMRNNDPKVMQRLWEISHFNKARKLTSQVTNQQALLSTVPEHYLKVEKNIRDSITMYLNKTHDENKKYDSILFSLRKRYEEHLKELEREYPRYHNLKYKSFSSKLNDVQQNIADDRLIINYYQTQDTIYTLFIFHDGSATVKFAKNEFEDLEKKFATTFKHQSDNARIKYSEKLSTLLFPGIDLSKFRHLDIIPDGIIWRLNFSLLSTEETKYSNTFLGDEVTIVYQYSYDHFTTLGEKKQHKNNKVLAMSYSKNITTIGSNYLSFRDLDDDIPGTSQEINFISENWEGDYYFANNASETLFKAKGTGYKILHLALHGTSDEANPDYSKLYFAQGDSLNDGLLHAYEIYNMNIDSDLIVLSACSSGEGQISEGEGIMSIGRSFASAGVKSVLLSKWEVSDISTPYIMRYFYEGLKKGMYKSEALSYAKRKFLENDADEITSAPYYWGSFYILGDDSPVVETSNNIWKLLVLAGAMVIIGIILVRRHQSKKS